MQMPLGVSYCLYVWYSHLSRAIHQITPPYNDPVVGESVMSVSHSAGDTM